jgi:GH25 family lysozyme M1 (1,4-beta-N-acetylmuramidase)
MLFPAFDLSGHQKGINLRRLLDERLPAWIAFKLTEAQGFVDKVSIALCDEVATLDPSVARSGYHFAYANRDPILQAKHFAAQERSASTNARPVLDIEGVYDSKVGKIVDVPEVGPQKALAAYRVLVEETEHLTGKPALIYTSPGFIATFFRGLERTPDAQFLAARSLWVAHYGTKEPSLPLFWKVAGRDWDVWQHDGGQIARSPDGRPIDANWIKNPEAVGGLATSFAPLSDIVFPTTYQTSLDEILDLVSRPGGQDANA